ncbi:hypothetical protein PICSAR235_02637 [Mycobacterium avium subsp. paratuberculosis]|nr:hypothetical protein PICSAR181_03742 [Mycobacterium avium subsp. paratuberculosis]CAG7181038.1 hypothetical protein PICSAR235_02637 [Mycobacterium avium subsp. paratuberculosis]CAG7198982.1 hypothetical protein PICSAR25_03765 [Mycobacterium avium subsp. paratuberculosis]CAG7272263.1 hypothetical protein PICSAR55_02221 [Mycobacterium avium subsp. paratuberculosis]
MNFPNSPTLMWTVPSSRGSRPISRVMASKMVSFSTPLAAMTSHSAVMTRSPSPVIFALVSGLYSR